MRGVRFLFSEDRHMPQQDYYIGVMMTPIQAPGQEFRRVVERSAQKVEEYLAQHVPQLRIDVFEFMGPHLLPSRGGYNPLELLQLGVVEKIERRPNFLLVVTEVEISSQLTTYAIALPSPLTNVGVISIKRLDPAFWGDPADTDVTARRLTGLMLHTIGHLLNLNPHDSPDNIMYRFDDLQNLEQMREITDHQNQAMQHALPVEARDKMAKPPARRLVLRWLLTNSGSIWRTVVRANPFKLAIAMTTMITAAFSLMIVIFFSAEIWDVGSTVELYQFGLFSLAAIVIATLVVYRAYPLRTVATRTRRVSESLVVTNTATLLTLFLTMLVLYTAFWVLTYLGILLFFPRTLMETWPTVDPAVRTLDHVKISTFIAAMGTLVGSLGGRVDNQGVMRKILFLDT
jgi:predicted Zn-dependent protease